uniref:Serpentine receptor class gamma n=1 Tax=Wuchereria bancrofti TaxID=6293 RepID=A0AAF5PT05_WUCBA
MLNYLNETLVIINQTICEKVNRTVDKPNITIGVTYLTLSLMFQIAYLPCFVTFLHRDYRCHSCFKLMIVIGIVDIITTNNDLTITGLYSTIGISYCTAPVFSKFSNSISLS